MALVSLHGPFSARAERVALDAAGDAQAPLLLIELVEPSGPCSAAVGGCAVRDPEVRQAIRDTGDRAVARGLAVEWLVVRTLHCVRALVELECDRGLALLVFGPDPGRLGRRRFRREARRLRRRASCLLWIDDDVA